MDLLIVGLKQCVCNMWLSQQYTMQLTARTKSQPLARAVSFLTNSWVAGGVKRIFFTGQPSLPDGTPAGLIEARRKELASLRVRYAA